LSCMLNKSLLLVSMLSAENRTKLLKQCNIRIGCFKTQQRSKFKLGLFN